MWTTGLALAHKFSQKAACAPTFSTRKFVTSLSQSREIFPVAVNGIEQRYF